MFVVFLVVAGFFFVPAVAKEEGNLDKNLFNKLVRWGINFFDPKYFNKRFLIKRATTGFGKVSLDIVCEEAKDYYYLLVKEGSVVRKVKRRYRVAAANFFGKNVCGRNVFYKLTAGFSAIKRYTDPVTGKECGVYLYKVCLYKYVGGSSKDYRCFIYNENIDFCN